MLPCELVGGCCGLPDFFSTSAPLRAETCTSLEVLLTELLAARFSLQHPAAYLFIYCNSEGNQKHTNMEFKIYPETIFR